MARRLGRCKFEFGLLGMLGLVPTLILSQAPSPAAVQVPEALACSTCSIALQYRFPLRGRGIDLSLVGLPNAVRMDAAGRIWVLQPQELPLVFDSTGVLIATVGQKGQGPGEFRAPTDIIPVDRDSTVVVDLFNARATVIGPDLKPVRFVSSNHSLKGVVVLAWPSKVVANGVLRTPASAGWPLHRVSFAGAAVELLSSFGLGDGAVLPDERPATQIVARSRSPNTFWSADRNRYRVSLWSETGTLLQSFERSPPWFKAQSPTLGNWDTPPSPVIAGIWEDTAGLLWVFANVPRASWKEAWPARRSSELSVRQVAFEKLFQTRVEVIDPRTRRVLARQLYDEFVFDVLPGPRAVSYVVDDLGVPSILVTRFNLVR